MRMHTTFGAALVSACLLAAAACGGTDSSDGGLPVEQWPESSADPGAVEPAPTTEPPLQLEAAVSPFTELEPGCLETVRSSLPASSPAPTLDTTALAMEGAVAPLPLPGHERRIVSDQVVLESVDAYFDHYDDIAEPEERRSVMTSSGFSSSVDTAFQRDADRYNVRVMAFGSTQGARDFYDVYAQRLCADARGVRLLPGPAGGVSYWEPTSDGRKPRAVTVLGDAALLVNICSCVAAQDPQTLAADWLEAIVAQATGGGALS